MKMAPGKADWPHTLADAISAEIVPWAGRGIGVCYTFPGKDQQSNPIAHEDRATLERLERAGKLTYLEICWTTIYLLRGRRHDLLVNILVNVQLRFLLRRMLLRQAL